MARSEPTGRGRTPPEQAGEPRRQAAVGRQPRAGEDQQQARDGTRTGTLVEHRDAERDRDDRRDVGDDRGAARADLADQRAEEDEGGGGARRGRGRRSRGSRRCSACATAARAARRGSAARWRCSARRPSAPWVERAEALVDDHGAGASPTAASRIIIAPSSSSLLPDTSRPTSATTPRSRSRGPRRGCRWRARSGRSGSPAARRSSARKRSGSRPATSPRGAPRRRSAGTAGRSRRSRTRRTSADASVAAPVRARRRGG